MAFAGPTYVGVSTGNGSASAATIDFTSSGRSAGDLLFIAVMTANQAVTISGWTEVATYSPQSRGTAGAAGGVRLTLFSKASTGSETTVSTSDSGDIQYAAGLVVRGAGGASVAVDIGDGNNVAATTSGSFGGVTTTGDDRLIAIFVATDRDMAAPSWGTATNANLANLAERFDNGTSTGTGGGIAIWTGEKQAAGATGSTTSTQPASAAYCWITLALKNGVTTNNGTASGNIALTGSASGVGAVRGSASGSFALSGSSSATSSLSGSAAGSISLSGSAIGGLGVSAQASGSFPITGSGAATARVRADATGSFPITGSAGGSSSIIGSGSGSFSLTGSATGVSASIISGSAAGTLPLTGLSVGLVVNNGQAVGSIALSGSSSGQASVNGAAAGFFPLSGAAAADSALSAAGSGFFPLSGESAAVATIIGEAAGLFDLSGQATGGGSTPVPIPAARIITPLRVQTVLTPDAQSVIVTPPRQCCVIILAGYEEVNMSSEYFQWPDKLAPAIIFYGIDWARRLGEATIVSRDFELVSGNVTLEPRGTDGTITSVSIEGGTAGTVAVIVASAVASDGEIHAVRVSIDIA